MVSPETWRRRVAHAVRGAGSAASSTLAGLLDVVYPRRCVACGVRSDTDSDAHICWDCLAAFEFIQAPFCSKCGDPVDGKVDHEFVCSWCRSHDPHFLRARSAVRFRGPARRALHALKYQAATYVARDLARLLASCVAVHYPEVLFDAVCCVPLYPRRERERTYNQSKLLAHRLAHETRLHVATDALVRTRDTPSQIELNASQRRANVRGAFTPRIPEWIEGRRLLLVDDVMTTGATVEECARVLQEAGAAGVHVVTVARG